MENLKCLLKLCSVGWSAEGDLTLCVAFDVPKLLVAIFKESEDVEERDEAGPNGVFKFSPKLQKKLGVPRIISKVWNGALCFKVKECTKVLH